MCCQTDSAFRSRRTNFKTSLNSVDDIALVLVCSRPELGPETYLESPSGGVQNISQRMRASVELKWALERWNRPELILNFLFLLMLTSTSDRNIPPTPSFYPPPLALPPNDSEKCFNGGVWLCAGMMCIGIDFLRTWWNQPSFPRRVFKILRRPNNHANAFSESDGKLLGIMIRQ